jgi:serine/threonine protein kinase
MLSIGYMLDEKYEVVKTLGQGGMSTVYLCKNTRLGNLWAIKEVKKELKGQIDLLAEPNILKNLSHPGIPRVVDIFYREDNLYIVEDYIEGETLQDYIKRNSSIESKETTRIVLSICDIIEYLHSFNPPIIYRDLKPSNIMITPKGRVVLIDFGISRVYKQGEDKDTICMGSKGYAAPEQYGIEQTCTQTDIYGIGAVMYFMVTCKAPTALLEPLKDESYSSELNTELKKIIQKAMQIDIESRYSSVNEMQKELLRFLEKNCETKTLSMKNTEEYSKTLLINSKSYEFNAYINNKMFISTDTKTTNVDKCKSSKFNATDKRGIHKEENNIKSKHNINRGTINFYRVDSNGHKVEIGENTVKVSNEKIKASKSNSDDNSRVDNQKTIKTENQFKVPYSRLKVKEDKSKKSVKRKLVSTLVCIAVILGSVYFFTDYGKTEQVINSNQTTNIKNQDSAESIVDINKNEKESNTNNVDANKDNKDNKDNNDIETVNQSTENKSNKENSSINESVIDKETSNVSDKTLQNKKENKTKNSGKAKGKYKYNESD